MRPPTLRRPLYMPKRGLMLSFTGGWIRGNIDGRRTDPMPEVTLQQAFELAIAHHQAGQLPEADSILRQILAVQPGHAPTMHLLGVTCAQSGNYSEAISLIGRA